MQRALLVKEFRKVGLSGEKWLPILKKELGIETIGALQYVIGREALQLLLQFVSEPREKEALRMILKVEKGSESIPYRDEQREMVKKRQSKLKEVLQALKQCQQSRQHAHTKGHENIFRETLEVAEVMWIATDITIAVAMSKMESMLINIDNAFEIGDHDSIKLVELSGGFSLATSERLALRGLNLNGLPVHEKILLKLPGDIRLCLPMRSQYSEMLCFETKDEEDEFFKHMALLGCSMPQSTVLTTFKKGRIANYCSTVKYVFVPMASCYLEDYQLQLSDEALSQLNRLDKAMTNKREQFQIEAQCNYVLINFGSHSLRGPFHFGGVYMWKCSSTDFSQGERPMIQKLHNDVIDAQVCMHLDNVLEETCISDIKEFSGQHSEKLKKLTFIQALISGGPQTVVGFPDWKNCLLASSKTWKLIDCGLNWVPIWDIIVMNHDKQFTNATSISKELKQQWEKLACTVPKFKSLSDEVKECVKSLSRKMKSTNENTLKQLLNKRREIEKELIDPTAWASLFLVEPNLQKFLCSITKTRGDKELTKISGLLQELVEPTDLDITNVFSQVKNSTVRTIYETDKLQPPILQQHFVNVQRFFKHMFQTMASMASSSHETIHPYHLMRGTAVIEMAVQMLQKYLAKTGQQYEECLLLTLLHPLQYCPEKGRFLVPLTKIDVEYLCIHFVVLSQEFFNLLDQPHNADLIMQSYLFYLTIHVSEIMTASDECTKSHISYLRQKIETVPEIVCCLEELHNNEWRSLKNAMESIFAMNSSGSTTKIDSREERDTQGKEADISQAMQEACISIAKENVPHCNIFEKLGLLEYFPEKLSLQVALQIRQDTLMKPQSEVKGIAPHAFIMVQKLLSFDHRCRMVYPFGQKKPKDDSDSESDEEDDKDSIHPLDCLLALLLCSDNFLRQDLLCRLATCQLALPLLLPSPSTQEPTLLLWAMRSIVKDFKLPDDSTYSGRLITYPAPFVSFLRIGHHSMSKSETLNGIINNPESDNKNIAFLGHNYPGGKKRRILANGLVEISWYLPGDKLYDRTIAFTNLRGDATNPQYRKQLDFLCEISSIHIVLLSEATLEEDATRQDTIELLKQLSQAPGGVILVQTESRKGFKARIAQRLDSANFKSKFNTIRYDTSSTVVYEKLQTKIKSLIEAVPSCTPLETAARKYKILIDEDDIACKRGSELADELYGIIEKHRQTREGGSPNDLLPLQRDDLWHQWAVLDKEQYRHKSLYLYERSLDSQDSEDVQHPQSGRLRRLSSQEYSAEDAQHPQRGRLRKMSSHDYSALQRKKMRKIRSEQYPLASDNMKELMKSFLNHIRTLEGEPLWYYMTWLKFKLDDLSRKVLPPFHAKIRNKRNELSGYQKQQDHDKEDKCQKELKALDKELINASFGLEHLLREVNQIYEAVVAHEDLTNNPDTPVASLPLIAAKLLRDGFPLEILDGDASHMPQKWISAVLSSLSTVLQEKLSCEPKIYVLSVLGVQSTGKSTLLNTLFGVQFSVSAGRCTRGAFMQLIQVHKSLHRKLGVHYFLLVDTEGLRAPELDRLNAREHDNELATFVIGVANLTLINVAGEVAGDMDDILHTAVHAFLRMSQVSLKPSCHIVHQHVAAVGAEEKMVMGRFKTKDNLDNMTKAAAKETGLETRFTLFTDVIKFDHEKDVSFFPDLWNGMPPMARVSSGYTEAAQQLKSAIILSSTDNAKYHSHSILEIKNHLETLWKAILQEDFVFSFQNTFEIVAFKTLDSKYGDWSWSFKNDMIEWERGAQNKILGCTAGQLYTVYQDLLQSLIKCVREKYMKYETKMNEYFEESNEIMVKWKPDTESRLLHLSESLQRHAQTHCTQLHQSRRGRAEAESKKEELSVRILKHVQKLVGELDKQTVTEDEVNKMFEEKWDQWICDLTATIKPLKPPSIPYEVEICVLESFKAQRKFVHERLGNPDSNKYKPLVKWGSRLHLQMVDYHIHVLQPTTYFGLRAPWKNRKSSDYFPLAQKHTDSTIYIIERHLTKTRNLDEDFKPQFVTDLLRIIQNNRKLESEECRFTEEYDVEMGLTACGYAIKKFEEMAEKFRKMHDPVHYIKYVMKPHFKKVFLDKYHEVDDEKIAAETVGQQLENPITECVMESLSSLIVDEMRGVNPWIKIKPNVIARILLEIGERLEKQSEDAFSLCTSFLNNSKESLHYWIEHFTRIHCDSGRPSRLSEIAQTKMSETINSLIRLVPQYESKQKTFFVHEWLRKFHANVEEEINLSLGTLLALVENREFDDSEFFSGEVIKGLEELQIKLHETYSTIKYSDTVVKRAAHDILFEEVAGCTAQCPFCKAQCELTNGDHPTSTKCPKNVQEVNHSTQHRPECLGGFRWEEDNTMVLDTCTFSVASDAKFRNNNTNKEWRSYKTYKEVYPDWSIPADKSLESSLFWKWFIGHYSTQIETHFGRAKTKIEDEWKELKWRQVKEWLKKEYNL